MRLTPGDRAPDFELPDHEGRLHRLSDHLGGRLWLAFYRYGGCPLCNLRLQQVIAGAPAWQEAGLTMLAVVQSSPARVAKTMATQRPPFPLLCDGQETVYAAYGLERSLAGYVHPSNVPLLATAAAKGFLPGAMDGTKTRLPADFLLDGDGVVERAFYARTIGEHVPFADIDGFAAG